MCPVLQEKPTVHLLLPDGQSFTPCTLPEPLEPLADALDSRSPRQAVRQALGRKSAASLAGLSPERRLRAGTLSGLQETAAMSSESAEQGK